MSHTCIANQYKHQGRCSICGKFMSAPANSTQKVTSVNLGNHFDKTDLLTKMRTGTYDVSYQKYNTQHMGTFSLDPKYLGNYVGSGKSKMTDDDTIFLYDVNKLHFKKLSVKDIISIDEL